jgi:hypothetical protein
MTTQTLRILLYPKNGMVFGQCLEHDVCVRGVDSDDVRRRLQLLISGYEDQQSDFFKLKAAPAVFFETWTSQVEPPMREIVHFDASPIGKHQVAFDFVEAVAA